MKRLFQNFRKSVFFTLIIIFICLLITELLVYNYSSIVVRSKSLEQTVLDLSVLNLPQNIERQEDGSILIKDKSELHFNFDDDAREVRYISISTQGEGKISNLSFYVKDDNCRYSYKKTGSHKFIPEKEGYDTYGVTSREKQYRLQITFEEDCKNTVVTSIILNRPRDFGINYLRLILVYLTIICFIFIKRKKLWQIEYNAEKLSHKLITIYTIVFCILVALSVSFMSKIAVKGIEYPLDNIDNHSSAYVQQFDAFQKGQLHLDINYDKAALESLANPYDTSERSLKVKSNLWRVWDRAYYDGRLYSYFGVAPVLTVYYPYYAVFGSLPQEGVVSIVLTIVFIIFCSLTFLELLKLFCKKIPILLLSLGIITINFGSLIYMAQTCPSYYYLAIMSGMAAVAAFLFFAFAGYNRTSKVKRRIFFSLSGINLVLIVASRPNMLLYFLIALPLFISVLLNKKTGIGDKLFDAVSFITPVLIGAAAIMYYNYARFGSPTEFGSIYQLTVNDISQNKLRLYYFFPSIYHFFFQLPKISADFPFVHLSYSNLSMYRSYMYISDTIGAFCFPATLGIFGIKRISRESGKVNVLKRSVYLLLIIAVLLIVFVNLCFAGVHIRYALDIMFPLTLLGVLILIETVTRLKEHSASVYTAAYKIVTFIFIATILLSVAFVFDNEPDNIIKYNPHLFMRLTELFK